VSGKFHDHSEAGLVVAAHSVLPSVVISVRPMSDGLFPIVGEHGSPARQFAGIAISH